MKGKFLKGFGKGIASLMAAAMLFTGNGITTLAAGVQASNVISEESTEVTEEENLLYSSEDAQNQVSSNAYQEGLTVGDLLDDVLLEEAEGSSSDNSAEGELQEEEQIVTAEYTSGGVTCTIEGTSMTITVTGDKDGTWPWMDGEDPKDDANLVTNIVVTGRGLTNANSMFSGFARATSINVSGLDTSQVTDMGSMFSGCGALSSLDLSGFVTSNVSDMSGMFQNCKALSSIKFSDNFTSNCTNVFSMFSNCKSLTTLDLSKFNLAKATTGAYGDYGVSNMLSGCTGLTDLYTPINLSADVTLPKSMYDGDTKYTSLPKQSNSIHLTSTIPSTETYTVTVARDLVNGYIEIYDAINTTALTDKAGNKDSAEVTINSYITLRFYPNDGYVLNKLTSTSLTYGYDYVEDETERDPNYTVSYGTNYMSIKLPDPIVKNDKFSATFRSGETPTVETVKVKVGTHENGSITINGGAANTDADVVKDSNVTVVVTPDDGYVVDKIVGNYVLNGTKTMNLYNPTGSGITSELQSDGSVKVTIPNVGMETTINATMKVKSYYSIKGLADTDNYTVTAKDSSNNPLTITSGTISNLSDGTKVTITVTPKVGKIIKSIICNGTAESGAVNKTEAYSFQQTINGKDITVAITAALDTRNLNITQPANGTITYSIDGGNTFNSGATAIGLAKGSTIKVKVTPNGGYQISNVKLNGVAQALSEEDKSGYTFDVTLDEDKTVTAEMEKQATATYTISGLVSTDMYTVTSTSTITDGKISGLADTATASITVTPKTGYIIKKITTKKSSESTASTVSGSENKEQAVTFAVTIASDNVEVTVEAEAVQAATYSITIADYSVNAPYTVTSSIGTVPTNGIITDLEEGAKVELTVTPKTNYYIKKITTSEGTTDVEVSGSKNQEKAVKFTVEINAADVNVNIDFGYLRTLTIGEIKNGKVEAAKKGTTTYYDDSITVKSGETVTVKVTPDSGYKIASVNYSSSSASITNEKGFSFDLDVSQDLTVTAAMEAIYHTVKVTQPANGSIKINGNIPTNGSYKIQEAVGTATVVVTANEGSSIKAVTLNGKAQYPAETEKSAKTIEFKNVTSDCTIAAEMEVTEYTVKVVKPADCTITIDGTALPSNGEKIVKHGDSVSLSISAGDNKKITSLTKDSSTNLISGIYKDYVYTVGNVKADVTITVETGALGDGESYDGDTTYTVTVKQSEGGTITSTSHQIKDGKIEVSVTKSSIKFTITADEGKKIKDIKADKTSVLNDSTGNEYERIYTLENISADMEFTAEFEDIKNTVTLNIVDENGKAVSDRGSVSINGAAAGNTTEVIYGDEIKITAQPKAGYEVKSIKIGNDNKGAVTEVKAVIKENTAITVTFVKETVYVITVEKEGKGEVTADGITNNKVSVVKGKNVTFKLTPEKDYKVAKILLDGADTLENGTSYQLSNVQKDHTVKVVFEEKQADAAYYKVGIKDTKNGTVTANTDIKTGSETITVGSEKITVNKTCSIEKDNTIKLYFNPDEGYIVGTVKVNNKPVAMNNNECLLTIVGDTVVEVTFVRDVLKTTITISENIAQGGEVTASGAQADGNEIQVDSDSKSEKITITANEGYKITAVEIDGESQEIKDSAAFTYEFTDLTKNHYISVVYEKTGLTLKLDGLGEISFQEDKNGKLTTSANLIPSDDKKPYLGAIFNGWFTEKNGKGTQVIDKNGMILDEAMAALKSGVSIYPDWDYITLLEKQKINIKSYFQAELDAFLAVNPKGKYRFTVYTEDSLNGKYAKNTKSKIGSASKSGLFTAKKPGVARIVLETYDKATKSYVAGSVNLYVAVEKPVATKKTLSYIGETAEVDEIFSYDYAGVLGNIPNTGSVEYVSSRPERVSVDSKTGKITATGFGIAKIKVIYTYTYDPLKKPNVVTKSVTITVKAPKFSASKVSLKAGKTKLNKLRYTYPEDKVSWSVENTAFATVDQTGMVTAVAAGETIVVATVTFDDGHVESYSYKLKVK